MSATKEEGGLKIQVRTYPFIPAIWFVKAFRIRLFHFDAGTNDLNIRVDFVVRFVVL